MRAISRRLERVEVKMQPALEAIRKAAVPEGPPAVEVLSSESRTTGNRTGTDREPGRDDCARHGNH